MSELLTEFLTATALVISHFTMFAAGYWFHKHVIKD